MDRPAAEHTSTDATKPDALNFNKTAAQGVSGPRDEQNNSGSDTANARQSPEAVTEAESNSGSRDVNCERLISALHTCFADLGKKNEEQMDKLRSAVEGIRPQLPATDKKTNFWNAYKTLADEHDKEFLEKYSTDLDTSLIFAGLFSAVSSAFIIQIQPELQPSPNDMNQALMHLLIHTVNGSIFSGPELLSSPPPPAPPALVLVAQSLLYVSLSCTLLAALLAVLGKQWLMYYSAAGERGTIEARGLERQRKFDGLRRWKFDMVLQMFPLLLQLSLLLFAVALSIYLWTVHHSLAIIVLSLTSFGYLAYVFLLLSAVVYPDSPFQTPLAPLVGRLIPKTLWLKRRDVLGRIRRRGIIRIIQHLYSASHLHTIWIKSQEFFTRITAEPRRIMRRAQSSYLPHIYKSVRRTALTPIFDTELPPPSPEVPAISWVLETSTDPHMVTMAAEMAVEMQWPSTMDLRPHLIKLRETLLACFDLVSHGDGRPIELKHIRDGMSRRAIHLGRAYCTLRCVDQSMESSISPKILVEPEKRDYFNMYEPELAHIVMIFAGTPHLGPILNAPVALTWALHVIPAGPIGGPLHPITDAPGRTVYSYVRHPDAGRPLHYFLTQLYWNIPNLSLSLSNFVDYLFCANAFVYTLFKDVYSREFDLRGVVRMDKRPFEGLLMVEFFKNLTRLMTYSQYGELVSYTATTTALLAARVPSHPMEGANASEVISVIYNFCATCHPANRSCIFPTLSLVRDLEKQPAEGRNKGVDWIYDALNCIQECLDTPNYTIESDPYLELAYADLLQALLYYGEASDDKSPPMGALRAILRALTSPPVKGVEIGELAFRILSRNPVWMENKELLPTLEEYSIWPSLGRSDALARDPEEFGPKYCTIGGALARTPELCQHMEGELESWIRVFFSLSSSGRSRAVKIYNSVLRETWKLDTGVYEFSTEGEAAIGLSLVALTGVWKDFDFTSSGCLDYFMLWFRHTIRAAFQTGQYWTAVTSPRFKTAFSVPLADSLVRAAEATKYINTENGLPTMDKKELLESVAKILKGIASEVLKLRHLADCWIWQAHFNRNIDELEKLITATSASLQSPIVA